MKYGIAFANIMNFGTSPGAGDFAQAAEASGYDSLWTIEHVVFPAGYDSTYPYDPSGKMPAAADTPMPDPLIWLSHVAAVTTKIRLATGILILPQRNPLVLAKELATLDDLSGGRVELGIGVGWLQEEFDALGIPWERRGKRTDEYVDVMRTLWSGEVVSYDGEFVSFDEVASNPRPAQDGGVPIVVGGHSEASARRAGRLGNGYFPGKGKPAELAKLFDLAKRTAEECGRDPEAIEFSAGTDGIFGPDPKAAIAELEAAGVDRVMVPSFVFLDADPASKMTELMDRVS